MFAVVRTGGKQYRVAAGDKIVVDRMGGEAGDVVRLGDVLFSGAGSDVQGAGGVSVTAQIIAQAKADKIIVFKKKRRHNYRRKNGHRQQHTILRITAVGDDTIEMAQARQQAASPVNEAETPVIETAAATTFASDTTPTPSDTRPSGDTSPVLEPQPPLKIEGTESPMVDAPASDDADTQDKVS